MMVRKLVIYAILLALVGGVAYGYLSYAVVALYEPTTPKVTYLFLVPKPYREAGFFYNNIDKKEMEQELKRLRTTNQPIPWHMDYDWVVNNSVYQITMDNRSL
ncbi:MAG: hypothetical protein AB1641_29965 [Thermodesulfobacteriota bacterium]